MAPVRTPYQNLILCLLLLMSLLGVFPLDVILPSFPALSAHLKVNTQQIAYSISLFALGVAAAQLVIGPLSDQLGRKRLLLLGLLASIGGALGCVLSTGFESFMFFRLLQALGCGCFVLTQALVQDLFEGKQRNAVRILQTSASGLFISLSPLLGTWLQQAFDWPASFLAFALLAGLALVMSLRLLQDDSRKAQRSQSAFSAYRALARDPAFLRHSTVAAIAFACHFSFIVVSPLLLMERLGLSAYAFSLVFLLYGLAYLFGGLIASAANQRLAASTQAACGLGLIACAGLALLLWPWFGELSAASVLVPMIICTTGTSLARPAATSSALELHPSRAGSAASLLNTLVFAIGAAASSLTAWFSEQLPSSLGVAFLIMASIGGLLMAQHRAHRAATLHPGN